MKTAVLALAGLVLCGSLAAAQTTVEEQIVVYANTATKTQLKKAIKLGMVKGKYNFMASMVEKEAQNVIDNRPYSTLSDLYNKTILGPESMEGLERRVRLNMPGLESPTLKLLNKKSTSANFLVKKVGVDAKAAVALWTTRKAGPDHVLGNADDRWMEFKLVFGEGYTHHLKNQWHVHSLDEVEGVGPSTIQLICDYAALNS